MDSKPHADSLIEARQILEIAAVQMAAQRRTFKDLQEIEAAQAAFYHRTVDQGNAVEEDLLFHLEVVSAGKNSTLKSLFMKIFPDFALVRK